MFNRRSFLQLTAISTLATGFVGKSDRLFDARVNFEWYETDYC